MEGFFMAIRDWMCGWSRFGSLPGTLEPDHSQKEAGMPKIPVGDIELNYVEAGAGFPLVLIHGLNGDQTGWALVMPEFAKRFRTLALDVRGHGATGKPVRSLPLKNHGMTLV